MWICGCCYVELRGRNDILRLNNNVTEFLAFFSQISSCCIKEYFGVKEVLSINKHLFSGGGEIKDINQGGG